MAKNLNVSLSFTADSSKVRAELNSLKKSLNELSSSTALKTPNFEFTKDLQEASRAAAQLKVQLDAAVNTKTGNLDLTKFSESMQKSGMSLEKYQNQLYQLGPAGEKAFADLTKAITMADVPLRRSSKLLDELWTTMKNTARWQLTSSAMHGFMGAVSSAYGYAKDLNASLNDIRIVTGASTEKMAEFAKEANNAAKALSTTTTDYTKASLIFYQQGLDDAQVKERTDITIKMANAAGASAEKVSDQLTAVWNNFYDGTKSLEYYADVMTALGAATASSTDEIAGGLEKFAAIGKTIGLSYEYAASALATITSNTRQSEEVVGTALKTIFARIQGLNLGETLDDGVTLNKYSQALEKVGISIFDSAGELKNMDNILDEMAAKWDTLNNSQQVALAQTVAGVRQYNQLIALMDNWDSGDSDSMVANLTTATNSTGTLQNQADIYAESWEAANKRVKASAEAVYSAILNDEFFIDLSNGFADLIDGVKIFIDSLGGVKGVLLAIGSIVTNVFSKQIGQGINNAIFSLKGFFNPQAILDAEINQKKKVNELLIAGFKDSGTTSGGQNAEVYAQMGAQQISYIQNAERMSEVEKVVNQQLMDRNQLLADEAIKAGQVLEKTEERIIEERNSLALEAKKAAAKNTDKSHGGVQAAKNISNYQKKVETLTKSYAVLNTVSGKLDITKNLPADSQEFIKLKTNVDNVVKSLVGLESDDTISDFNALGKAINMSAKEAENFYKALQNADSVSSLQDTISQMAELANTGSVNAINSLRSVLINCTGDTKKADEMMENYLATIRQFGPDSVQAQEALNKLKDGVSNLTNEMDKTKEKPIELSQAFSKAASAVMAVGQAYTTITGIIDVFNDSEATTKEKIMAVVSGIGMLIPAIVSIGSAFSTASVEVSIFGATTAIAMWQITLIVMAITALTIGIALLINHLNVYGQTLEQANKKLEQTSKDAENAANAVEDAKNAYQDLTDTIEDYQGAEDALDTLIEGTEEFKNQLKEANEYARKLMDTYGVKGTYNAEKGLWEISDEALEAGMSEYNKKLEQAYIENAIAQNALSAAKNHQAFAKLVAEDDKTQGEHVLENTNNQHYNNTMSAAGDPAGAAGAALGNLIYSWIESFKDVKKQEEQNKRQIGVLDEVLKYWDSYNGDLNKISQELNLEGIDSKSDLLNALGMTESALQDLMNSLSSNTEAILENNKFIIDNTWKNNKVYSESEHKDALNNLAAAEMMTESQRILDQYDKYNNKQMENLQKSYAKKKGLTFVSEEDGVAEFLDAEGQTVKFSNDSIKAFMAQEQALENIGVSLESFAENLNKLAQKSNEGDLAGALAYSQASGGDISDVTVGYADSDVQTFDSTESLQKYLNIDDKAFEALWKSKGFMSAEAYLESFNTQVSSFKDQVDKLDIAKDLSIFNELSLGVAQSIESSADKMNLGPLGQSAGEQYIAGLNSMLTDLDKDDQITAMQQLSTIDWSSWDAMEQAQRILSQFGKTIDTTDPYWKTFIDNMRIANRAFPDFTKLQKDLKEINGILGSLDFGNVIKDEDYERLVAYNQEWEKFFILQADGTRKFIGNSAEMLNATRKNIVAQKDELATRKDLIEKVQQSGADWNISAMSIDKQYGDGKDGKLSDQNGKNNGYKSGEDMINNIMANQTQQLISNNDAIKEILNNNNYDETAINTILQEARDGNRERLETMLTYLNNYMSQDLEIAEGQLNEMLASTATTIHDLQVLLNQGTIDQGAYVKQLQYLIDSGIIAAESLDQLYSIVNQGIDNGAIIDYYTYAQGLINVAEQYNNVSNELGRYKEALETGNQESIAAAQDQLEAAISAGEMAEKYDLTAEHIERYADELKSSGKYSAANEKALTNMAKDQLRFDRAVNTATEHMEDWNKDLKVAEKTGHLVSETADEMASAYGDLLDIDGSELSADFLKNTTNLENMKKALEGDEEAYRALQEAARLDIAARVGLDDSQFQTDFANLMATCEMPGLSDIEVGTSLDNQAFLDGLSEMVTKAGMTAQEATDYLSSMGVDAEVVNEPTTIKEVQGYDLVATPSTVSVPYVGAASDGTPMMLEASYPTVSYEPVPVTTEKTVAGTALKVTSASKSSGGGVKHTGSTTAAGGSNATKSSGGGNKTKSKDLRKKKVDMVDRYKPINDKMDDMADKLDDASKAADRLWGTARIKQMQKVNSILEDEIELIKEKKSEAEAYLVSDKNTLNEAAAAMNVAFTYDKNGNITNYESQLTELWKRREDLISSFGEEASDEQKKQLDEFDKDFENLKSLLSQYDETRELIEDLENDERDKKYEIQDNNFEMLNEGLEIKVQFNEDELEKLDYYIDKLDGDFYMMAEAYGELSKKGDIYKASLADQSDYLDQLKEKYANNEISQAAYIEGLQNANDAVLSNLQSLQELDDEMTEYYSNTLNAASDELSKYTDKMEHLSSVLDHYSSIMDLLGKSKDYEVMGSILEGQAHTARNELDAAKATYALYDAEVRHWEDLMSQATTDDEMEVYKKNWEAAKTAANDAQEAMLSKTESWAEAMKAVVQNNMDELNQSLEEALTGGFDFDTMLNSMERASSLQEEYLTTTNKIYETNKLMRTAQQEIDKSTNSVAKRRLAQFINETEQLQNQTKLSNYELEIQQAKYDLLLAEIALEEAQNAKSTVRLQRDAEGNFGYVYTADQDKVAQAQQELEDAQNSLYNIGLEGANDYSQKYAETMQEMYDTMAELQQAYLDGEIATQEEYDAKMLAAKEYYFNKLKDYSGLYQVALTTDSRVINDAWSSDFNDMIYKTGELQSAVNQYTKDSASILQSWSTTVKQALSETGLDDVDDQVKAVTDESDKLKESLIGTDGKGGVVKAIQDEITEVGNLTGAYAKVREQIQGLISDHEKLMDTIDDTQKTEEEAAKQANANAENATDKTTTDQQTQNDSAGNEESAAAQHDEKTKAGVALAIIRNATAAGWGNGSTRKKNLESKGFSYNEIQGLVNTYFGNSQALIAANGINWPSDYSKYVMSRFNTGGYTGSWGSYGKLGILDEKELVLNQGDTANFLASMEVLERILQVIDLHSMNAQLGGLLSSPSYGGGNNETTIEQNVHIEASFPGVTDRNELQEAFNNLVNQASQYANRK